nr:hypothetical protein DLTAUQXX_DLTAUQXX_CDS_0031 [uncultured phage]CAI9750107.1 hypothetical protein LUIDIZRK_LUIDIZRK_CDS_0031 [uncultured phage]
MSPLSKSFISFYDKNNMLKDYNLLCSTIHCFQCPRQ